MPIVSEETKARYELCYASILALKDIFGAKSMEDLLVKAQECRDAYDHLNAFADEPISNDDRAPEFGHDPWEGVNGSIPDNGLKRLPHCNRLAGLFTCNDMEEGHCKRGVFCRDKSNF